MMARFMDLMVVVEETLLFLPIWVVFFLISLEVLEAYLTVFLFTGSVHKWQVTMCYISKVLKTNHSYLCTNSNYSQTYLEHIPSE